MPEGLWSGDLAYEGYSGKRFVEEIHFPSLSCGYAAGSSFVFGSGDSGVVSKGAAFFKPGATQRRTYCGGMQFSALINTNGPSLYIDHRDPSVGTKGCEIAIAKRAAPHLHGHPRSRRARAAARRLPHPLPELLHNLQGDWFEAGQIYKKWGTAPTVARQPQGG